MPLVADALSTVADPTPRRVTVRQTVYRYSDYDTPFWVRPNSEPGRWHAAGDAATQYFSQSLEGAWAELIRAEELTTEDDVAMVDMPMWAADVDQGMVADYGSFEKAEVANFPPDALVDEDWRRCQLEGRRLRDRGYAGVLAPSAALPEAVNLTLFGARYAVTWAVPRGLASAISARVVTRGAPPAGLLSRVRAKGAQHEGYVRWREG